MRQTIGGVAILAVLLFECTSAESRLEGASTAEGVRRGGTLRVAIWDPNHPDLLGLENDATGLDPFQYIYGQNAIHRLLLRTLMSFAGRPASAGGGSARPDLAAEMPSVSSDGLTWTFHLRPGLRYAPPFDHVEIVAADIRRALERTSRTWPLATQSYGSYYSPIVGFDEFWAGDASSISGLETPDPHTLVVRLERPTGDLPFRFSMPAAAPIPEGAADGHARDYGRFLVASGPYMVQGSTDVEPTLAPSKQRPAAGYEPARFGPGGSIVDPGRLTLVRNPSWDPSTDDLRPAYADRIEFVWDDYGADDVAATLYEAMRSGSIDVDVVSLSGDIFAAYARDRIVRAGSNNFLYFPMNVGVPPFDDVHVRKAVVLGIDRGAIIHHLRSANPLAAMDHIAPDGTEAGLLAGWQPDWLRGRRGLDAARHEMARSRYDRNADGRCDAAACRGVPVLVQDPREPRTPAWAPIRRTLTSLGIGTDATLLPCGPLQGRLGVAAEAWGLSVGACASWAADYPNGSNVFVPLLSGSGLFNLTLLGASRQQLRTWGYDVRRVPSVDARIDVCMQRTGEEQTACWAGLDQYLMSEVVPWVPIGALQLTAVLSDRVARSSFDVSTGCLAYDRIALVPGSS